MGLDVHCTENDSVLVWAPLVLRLSGHILVKCSLRRPSTVRMQNTIPVETTFRVYQVRVARRGCACYLMIEPRGMTCGNAAPGITPLGLAVRTRSC